MEAWGALALAAKEGSQLACQQEVLCVIRQGEIATWPGITVVNGDVAGST